MPSDDTIFAPRNIGGLLVRLSPTPDGGSRVEAWSGEAWEPVTDPSVVDASEVLKAKPASNELLKREGINVITGEPLDEFDKALLDVLEDDREMPAWKPPKWLWRGLWTMYTLGWAATIVVAIYIGYLFYK